MDFGWPQPTKATLEAMREDIAKGAELEEHPKGRLVHSIHLLQELAGCLDRETINVVNGVTHWRAAFHALVSQ